MYPTHPSQNTSILRNWAQVPSAGSSDLRSGQVFYARVRPGLANPGAVAGREQANTCIWLILSR